MTAVADRKRIGAGVLLLAAAGTAAAAARWLLVRGRDLSNPPPPAPALAAFGACLLLAFLAGRLAGPEAPAAQSPEGAARPRSAARRLAAAGLGLACLLLFLRTLSLQDRRPVALAALATWAGALAAAGAAFAIGGPPGRAPERRRTASARLLVAALPLLGLGAWSRLAGLDAVPAGFGGDEASQIRDALDLLGGGSNDDLFGSGWYGTMRLGMLPAGLGALCSDDPIAGPRRPYAIAGTLSLAAAMAVGGLLAGGWGVLATGALLAAVPHHVHFSRLASVMILDALLACLFLLLALSVRKTASPAWGFWLGAVAGLALYGYTGGRVVPVAFLLTAPFLVFGPAARGRRVLLAFAMAAGFALAAAPNLRFAARHFDQWNSRYNQIGIFHAGWWDPKVRELGRPARVMAEQFVAGTVGLLSRNSVWPWFPGYPIARPFFLPALALTGLGWLLGRGRIFSALLPGLVAAGNLAGVILTDSTPAPQRLSSLFPVLAVLGAAAIAGLLSLLPGPGERGAWVATGVGALALAGALLAGIEGVPPWWDPAPGYGGSQAAFVPAAARVLRAPRFARDPVYLHGLPYVDTQFPLYGYLLPESRLIDVETEKERDRRPAPGLHLVVPEWASLASEWKARWGITRAIALPDPADPRRDVGCLVRVR
ncbi:MAG: glycosyltransferase family 39 protein [Acidobacteriota bacterium]